MKNELSNLLLVTVQHKLLFLSYFRYDSFVVLTAICKIRQLYKHLPTTQVHCFVMISLLLSRLAAFDDNQYWEKRWCKGDESQALFISGIIVIQMLLNENKFRVSIIDCCIVYTGKSTSSTDANQTCHRRISNRQGIKRKRVNRQSVTQRALL